MGDAGSEGAPARIGGTGIWGHAAALITCAAVAFAWPGEAMSHVQDPPYWSTVAPGGSLTEVLGKRYERTRDGLFRVRLPDGGSVLTHGPDPKSEMNPLDADGTAPSAATERPPICASDYYQHVLYAHLTTKPNLVGSQTTLIRSAIKQSNALLSSASMASGGVTADYKVLCDGAGEIRVDSFATPSTAFSDTVTAAKAAGFADRRADYTIFLEAPSSFCGIGSYQRDSSLSADNRSNVGGGYAVSYKGCWLDETPMHENAHNQGAVQEDAPSSTGTGGHCFEERDVLCYSPDGGDRNQAGTVSRCPNRVEFDCGDDDYFDPAPEPGEYLSSHWNLGSALNRFIVFGQGAQTVPPDPPCPEKECAAPVAPDGSGRGQAAAPAGDWTYTRINLPRKRPRVSVRLDGPDCAPGAETCETELDLYVRAAKLPSAKRADCRSEARGSDESCEARSKMPSRVWWAGVHSLRAAPGATFTISAK